MAKQYLTCEIKKVFLAKDGKFGMSLHSLEDNDDVANSNSYKAQFDNFTINYFLNGEGVPSWVKEGNKIKFCYSMNNGWININQDDGVDIIPDEKTPEESKTFNQTVDELDDSFDPVELEKELEVKTDSNNDLPKELTEEKLIFAKKYLREYEEIGKLGKPDFSLKKLDQGNYKDVITSCKIAMSQKFGH